MTEEQAVKCFYENRPVFAMIGGRSEPVCITGFELTPGGKAVYSITAYCTNRAGYATAEELGLTASEVAIRSFSGMG